MISTLKAGSMIPINDDGLSPREPRMSQTARRDDAWYLAHVEARQRTLGTTFRVGLGVMSFTPSKP